MKPYGETTIEEPVAAPTRRSLGTMLGRLMISAVSWSTHAAATGMLLLVYVVIAGAVRQEIEEYELGMPQISEPQLSLCAIVSDYWYIAILALIIIDGPIAIAVCYLPRKYQWITWVWYAGFLLLAIGLLTWACVGLVSPLIFTTGPLMADPHASINVHPSLR